MQQQRRFLIAHSVAHHLDRLVDVPIGDGQVQLSIIVVVDEVSSPADVVLCIARERGPPRPVFVGKRNVIQEQRVVLIIKVRHDEIRTPVAVDISRVHAHAGLRVAIRVVRHLRVHGCILERAVVMIDQQEVW